MGSESLVLPCLSRFTTQVSASREQDAIPDHLVELCISQYRACYCNDCPGGCTRQPGAQDLWLCHGYAPDCRLGARLCAHGKGIMEERIALATRTREMIDELWMRNQRLWMSSSFCSMCVKRMQGRVEIGILRVQLYPGVL